ncbi:MAG: RNA polymerase sigma factor, partial [Oscillospiraceae bacterium]|nr:RNA polymerase sigma factor [Oscillospiraceae bacterium]
LDDEEARLDPADTAPQPEEAAEREETRRMVREGLYALPDNYRQVLVLRELEQLSYTEIAEAAQLDVGTVKSRISRARTALRNYLAAGGNFFERGASKKAEGKGAGMP